VGGFGGGLFVWGGGVGYYYCYLFFFFVFGLSLEIGPVQIVSRLLILIISLLILCLHVCVDIVLCSREEWLLRSNVSSISFLRFQPHP
jgi:hypothetical protein